MTDATVFLRGAVLDFSIAAPVGPIGVLCIRRTLTDGAAIGLAVASVFGSLGTRAGAR